MDCLLGWGVGSVDSSIPSGQPIDDRPFDPLPPQVITNCVIVLNELLAEEGGMAVNQPLILHLLSRVGEFTEWGLTHVLALVAKYVPADEEELFSIMNLLDPVLRTSNSGVVLATIKCFLHLTTAIPELQPQVRFFSRGRVVWRDQTE